MISVLEMESTAILAGSGVDSGGTKGNLGGNAGSGNAFTGGHVSSLKYFDGWSGDEEEIDE